MNGFLMSLPTVSGLEAPFHTIRPRCKEGNVMEGNKELQVLMNCLYAKVTDIGPKVDTRREGNESCLL